MDPDQWKRRNLVKYLGMKPQIIKEITSTTYYRVQIIHAESFGRSSLSIYILLIWL